ncbi:MAG TPA: ATP-binding protein [Planctomycetota bacterium]|nr:ATP-binding protein [Planctomycetota bacterium]
MRKRLGKNTSLVSSQPPPVPDGTPVLDRTFASTDDAKNEVLEEVLNSLRQHGWLAEESEEIRMRLCLDEALRNAVMHGNKFDPAKTARVRLWLDAGAWTALIEDQGAGFQEEDLPDPDAPENLLEEGGRGVHLIRTMMDDARYFSGGSALFMQRRGAH